MGDLICRISLLSMQNIVKIIAGLAHRWWFPSKSGKMTSANGGAATSTLKAAISNAQAPDFNYRGERRHHRSIKLISGIDHQCRNGGEWRRHKSTPIITWAASPSWPGCWCSALLVAAQPRHACRWSKASKARRNRKTSIQHDGSGRKCGRGASPPRLGVGGFAGRRCQRRIFNRDSFQTKRSYRWWINVHNHHRSIFTINICKVARCTERGLISTTGWGFIWNKQYCIKNSFPAG